MAVTHEDRILQLDLYLPTPHKEADRNTLVYMGDKLWNNLLAFVQNYANIEFLKHSFEIYKPLISY